MPIQELPHHVHRLKSELPMRIAQCSLSASKRAIKHWIARRPAAVHQQKFDSSHNNSAARCPPRKLNSLRGLATMLVIYFFSMRKSMRMQTFLNFKQSHKTISLGVEWRFRSQTMPLSSSWPSRCSSHLSVRPKAMTHPSITLPGCLQK